MRAQESGSYPLAAARLARHQRSASCAHQQVQNPGREGLEARESNSQVFQQAD